MYLVTNNKKRKLSLERFYKTINKNESHMLTISNFKALKKKMFQSITKALAQFPLQHIIYIWESTRSYYIMFTGQIYSYKDCQVC